jgi:hypothetical protein
MTDHGRIWGAAAPGEGSYVQLNIGRPYLRLLALKFTAPMSGEAFVPKRSHLYTSLEDSVENLRGAAHTQADPAVCSYGDSVINNHIRQSADQHPANQLCNARERHRTPRGDANSRCAQVRQMRG